MSSIKVETPFTGAWRFHQILKSKSTPFMHNFGILGLVTWCVEPDSTFRGKLKSLSSGLMWGGRRKLIYRSCSGWGVGVCIWCYSLNFGVVLTEKNEALFYKFMFFFMSVLIVWMIYRLLNTGSLPTAWHHASYPHTLRPIDPLSPPSIYSPWRWQLHFIQKRFDS